MLERTWRAAAVAVAVLGALASQASSVQAASRYHVELVKDIDPGSRSGNPRWLTKAGGVLYFINNRNELWRSDGTAAGTRMIRAFPHDHNPGCYSSPASGATACNPEQLTAFHGKLYFRSGDRLHGPELWKSNGTRAGTKIVTDIGSGKYGSFLGDLTVAGDKLFFTTDTGYQLWRTDGTAAGTKMIKGILFPGELAAFKGVLYLSAEDENDTHGEELWRSDGTAKGTKMVKDINPGGSWSYPQSLTVSGGTLFFSANDGVHGNELWRSDGTLAGTKRVKDGHGGAYASPLWLTDVGHRLFFDAPNGANALWRTDGTAAGTAKLKEFRGHLPYNLTDVAGALYFVVRDGPGASGFELWRSGGTAAKTRMVKEINPNNELPYGPTGLAHYGGTLIFAASDGVHGAELWRSNGTEAGTTMVKDIDPGSGSSFPGGFTQVHRSLYFTADDGTHGAELWKAHRRKARVR